MDRWQVPDADAAGDGEGTPPRWSPWWLLIVVGVSLVCLAVPPVVTRAVVLPSFARLEHRGAERDATRCVDIISREARHVEKVSGDWAEWDDTYRFVVERGRDYVSSNLNLASLCRASDIHLLYIVNARGEVVWGEAFDAQKQQFLSLGGDDQGVPDCLRRLVLGPGDARRCGIVLTEHAPLLVAARPIVPSSGEGPSRGTFIMGRFLDHEVVEDLSRAAGVPFRLERIEDPLPISATTSLDPDVRALSDGALEASTVIPDVVGRPALLLVATVPREIMTQGRAAAGVVALSLLCSLLIVAASLFYVAATRSARLERESHRLEELVDARTAELRESAERFRALTENSRDTIMRFDRELRHLYVSPAVTVEVGLMPEEMVGKTHAELGFPQHLLDIWEPAMRGVFETGQPARIEFQLPSGTWLDWSLYPEMDGDQVIGLTTSARDITRRIRMEAELREREQTISTIYQTVQAGIVVIDAETQEILDANQAAADATGWTKEELVGSHCYSTICVACEVPDLCPVVHLGREITNVDTTIRRKGLPPLPVLKTVVPFQLGGRACLLESFVDISELRRAREALEQSEGRLRALMEHMPVGIAIADQAGRFQFVNRVFVAAFGYSMEDTPTVDAWEERTQAYLESLFAESGADQGSTLASGRITASGRLAVVCADGSTRYGAFRVASLGDDLIITGSDVTAQVLAEREVRNLSRVVEQSPVSVVVTDREGIVQYVNPCFTRVTGYELEEMVGRRPSLLNAGLLPREHYTELWQTILDGRVWEGELCNRRKDGSVFWEHAWITPVFSRTQPTRIATFIAIKEDVTERRRIAQELAEAKEAAEAASRAKSAFLASMSHEIRTPLNAVLGFAQLMHDDPALTGRLRDYVGRILRAGEHLLTLINDVLEMSRIEAGRVEVRPESFALHRMLEDVVSLFHTRAADKGLSLAIEYDGPAPGHVTTDQGRLRQILVNLVGNAVKFTSKGGITIRVSCDPRDEAEWPLTLAVEDTGTGIAPDDIGRLFRPFEQTATGVKLGEGTGLGLAISRSFARLLRGDIAVTSEFGKGSAFRVTIPVRSDSLRAPRQLAEQARRVVGVEAAAGGARVLVADDNALNAELLTTMLGQLGFDVRSVRDGDQALRAWREWRPDAVLMDIHMPRMDGYEATRAIRAEEPDGSTAVIAISASALSEERQAALRAGCDDFIAKPISAQEALGALARHTGVRYVYGDEPEVGPSEKAGERTALLDPGAMRSVPGDLAAALERAAREARIDRIAELVERLRVHDPRLADGIRQRAAAYDYDAILGILGEGKPSDLG